MLPFYHPSTILVVDDDATFLQSFEYRYRNRFNCRVIDSPELAIGELRRALSAWQIQLIEGMPDGARSGLTSPDDALLKVSTGGLRKLSCQSNRSEVVSVVVVDYAMPTLSGIEFCRAIGDLPVKRLLLTGKTGDETAVKAFNEGLIDHFLVKQDPAITEKLPAEIARLQQAFFEDAASPLTPAVHTGPLSFLAEPSIAQKIESIMTARDVIEHYVSLSPFGVLFGTRQGSRELLIMVDDETARAQIETAEVGGAPSAFIEKLRSDGFVALFPTDDGFYQADFINEWETCSHRVIEHVDGWRFALVDGAALEHVFARP